MKATNQSDEWLMGQVVRGQRDCLEVLVRRYATPLLTYLTRMCGDAHRAEELVQEVFLAVWTKRKTYKLDKPLKAWLYTIATNRCRSAFRGAKGKPMVSLDDAVGDSPVGDHPSPMETAVGVENAAIVSAAVATLPEQQRMVVTLRIWGGMSYAEIATSAGRTEATIRSHMHRALESLRKSLSPVMTND
jgi:RNA polymerase sigma-70 factor (ECF subfamily)